MTLLWRYESMMMTGQFPGGAPGMSKKVTVLTVLVVEDDVLMRMHGIDILEDAGFHVLEATNADDALVILNEGTQVHMLFSDIEMPGSMDGIGLAQAVHERWPLIHVLLTSSHHRLHNVSVPGTGQFVRKPWTSQALVGQVQEMIAA